MSKQMTSKQPLLNSTRLWSAVVSTVVSLSDCLARIPMFRTLSRVPFILRLEASALTLAVLAALWVQVVLVSPDRNTVELEIPFDFSDEKIAASRF